jgi:hypothetical protein
VAVLTLAFVFPSRIQAAPDKLDVEAKAKLEVLKKRFPTIVATWVRKHSPVFSGLGEGTYQYTAKVRFIRRTSATTAKITFALEDPRELRDEDNTGGLVSIYLSYYDGLWTTTRMESVLGSRMKPYLSDEKVRRYLLLAIDEMGDK